MEKLQVKDNFYKSMFIEATVGILVVEQSGAIIAVNPYSEKLFGYEKDTLIGQKIEILLPESLKTRHVKYREQYHKNPSSRSMGANLDLKGKRKNGSEFPIEISLSYLKFQGQTYAIAYASDATLQHTLLEDLKEGKKRLIEAKNISEDISKVVEESLNEIFIFNGDTLKFVQVNRGARENIGHTLEEMQQMTPVDIKPNFDHKQFVDLLKPLKEGKEDKLLFETIHQRKDQTTYPVEVHLQYSQIGLQPVYVAFITDITQRKVYEQKLLDYSETLETKIKERTQKLSESESKLQAALVKEKELGALKSRFVSMASHEFRTPLSSILSSADLISRYEKEDQQDKRMKHIRRIESSVKNLTIILNDFLSLEKLESGQVRYNPVSLEINDYVEQIIEEVSLISKKDQTIVHQHTGDNMVSLDEHLMKNVLINLLSNGIKYSPNGANVELITHKQSNQLSIQVKDYGIGIPQEDQKHMFTRFFRATNVTAIQGTGLGLTIVKRYLDLMRGEITFESTLGEGSSFSLTIPQSV